MPEKLYAGKTEKELKSTLNLYSAILILSIILPILFNLVSYYISGKMYLKASIIFILLIFWSLLNIDYLKNILKNKNTDF